jgi:hypothetical protein
MLDAPAGASKELLSEIPMEANNVLCFEPSWMTKP